MIFSAHGSKPRARMIRTISYSSELSPFTSVINISLIRWNFFNKSYAPRLPLLNRVSIDWVLTGPLIFERLI